MEFLPRAAVDLRQDAYRAMGPLRPAAQYAEIRRRRVSHHLVVGRRTRGQGEAAHVITRRRALVLSAGAFAAMRFAPAPAQPVARHGMSAFGDLEQPADF